MRRRFRTSRVHDLRHTAATRLNDNGVEPFTIAAILGHATIQMTARYPHGTEEGTRRAVDTLVDSEENCHKSLTKQKRQARMTCRKPLILKWTWGGSNSRPPHCERGALPAELHAQKVPENTIVHTILCQRRCLATPAGTTLCVQDRPLLL